MSILNNLTQLFSRKKAPDSEQSVGLSLAMPDDLSSVQAPAAAQGQPAAAEPAAAEAAALAADQDDVISVPLLGRRRIAEHQRILWWLLGLALVVLGAVAFVALTAADRVAQQLNATGQALMQSQRLAKSVTQALVGVPQAFVEVRESSGILARTVRGLRDSDYALRLDPLDPQLMPQLEKILPLVDRAEKNAAAILAQEKVLTQVGTALRTINRQSSDLLEIAETVSSLKLQQGASPAEISAAGQLVMLTQRIGKSSNEFLTAEGVSPEAVFLLGKDLNSFKEIAQGLLNGSPELRLNPTKDAQTREQIEALIKLYEQTRTQAGAILGNLQGLVSARTAQIAIVNDSEPLRRDLEALQAELAARTGLGTGPLLALVGAAAFALLCAAGLARVQLLDSRRRQIIAEAQRQEAERQEQEAKRINDANQAAILRLMNELQAVAEGDLTQEATVTEDITGAIADSVNYT
ncbi:MAG: type IV pili methyl-accepting chemotaxis transducer N-terminal domain-containing protein, partial [Hylemonella sp.]